MGELHRLGQVRLAPSGGWPAGWSDLHPLSPPPWPSTALVDMCPRSRGPKRHKTWPASQNDIKHGVDQQFSAPCVPQ
jgi:hypothetical protein